MKKNFVRFVLFGLFLGFGFFTGWYAHSRFATNFSTLEENSSSLQGLGYLSGYEEPSKDSGLIVHDEEAHGSLILWTSAHDFDVYLMQPDGKVIHRWPVDFFDVWPEGGKPHPKFDARVPTFSRFAVEPDGDLYVIFGPYGLAKVDPEGDLLWSRRDMNHHDLIVKNEKVYSLTQDYRRIPIRGIERTRRTGFLTVYAPDGEVLARYDLLDVLLRAGQRDLIDRLPVNLSNVLHTNSLEFLGGNRFLISVRKLNAVFEIDLAGDTVPWAMVGRTSKQHAAHRVGDDVLLLDNGNRFESSRVVQFDRATGNVEWQYGRSLGGSFYTQCCGAVQRLDNGNTFFVDSASGRMVEVTRERETVWEFVNPHRTDAGKVAVIPEAERLDRSFFVPKFLKTIIDPTPRSP